jgi:hypothetical protein
MFGLMFLAQFALKSLKLLTAEIAEKIRKGRREKLVRNGKQNRFGFDSRESG